MQLKVMGTLFLGLFLLTPAYAQTVATDTIATSTTATTTTTTTPDYQNSAVVEAKVRSYFADVPVMIAIAQCESKFRQFNSQGQPLNGGSGGMMGIFQISQTVHATYAMSLAYDINTVDGNLGYARYLYQKSGTDPWISSFPCWGAMSSSNPEASTAGAGPAVLSTGVIDSNLSFGMINPQIVTLQRLLNAAGFIIATEGPGSVGNETNKFGSLTRDSVRRFQCAQGIVCSGDEGSTGYGYVGVRTRAALLSASSVANSAQTQPAAQTSSTTASSDKAAKISALEAQLADYTKHINEIKAQLDVLRTGL